MNSDYLKKVEAKEQLAILTDKNGHIIWQTDNSPASGLYRAYFNNSFLGHDELILYANQVGMAFGLLINKLNIVECHAIRMSNYGLKLFQKSGIRFDYKKLIPLVRSSKDENKVCPIEKFLSEHSNPEEQWKFLKGRFQDEGQLSDSCKLRS